MAIEHSMLRRPGASLARKTGIVTLVALNIVILAAILAGFFLAPARAVNAATLRASDPLLTSNYIGAQSGEINEPVAPLGPADPVAPATVPPVDDHTVLDISSGRVKVDGELTPEDDGTDWFSFSAEGGQNYIIELEGTLDFIESELALYNGHLVDADGQLADPSILQIVDQDGQQVLDEHDGGGFMGGAARAFFVPQQDGTYYIAVGSGAEDRAETGTYTLFIRVDDHAEDYRPHPDVVLRPGESITATIDSDFAPDHPDRDPWDWGTLPDGVRVPIYRVPTLDDRDTFRIEITNAGTYRVSVINGPAGVGVWSISDGEELIAARDAGAPYSHFDHTYTPGTYYVEVGTPYESTGNTGTYTITLTQVTED